MTSISVVIPLYHDADALQRTLESTPFYGVEVIVAAVADDDSVPPLRTERPELRWIEAPCGRARQMNAGASHAHGDWLLFLHADTRLPDSWPDAVAAAELRRAVVGCYRFRLDSSSPWARVIEAGVAIRVGCFGLPYGDQAIFVRRECFAALGGFTDVPIMEDVDFVRRAQRKGSLYCSPLPIVTSARRWERDGWVRRSARHLMLIALYLCGVPPTRLIRLDRARFSL
jgi:rSAM/selenodomain-associated transferase 2